MDGEDMLMKQFAASPFMPLDTIRPKRSLLRAASFPLSIVDQSDEFKEKVVHTAEANGLPDIANSVSASETDPLAWDRFMARGGAKDKPFE
jgi:hypothetical protein